MNRPRIKTAEVKGKRVMIMEKMFDNGIWRKTLHNVCKVATSGAPESIERYVKYQRYAKPHLIQAYRQHEREIAELRAAM